MDLVKTHIDAVRVLVNNRLVNYEPWQIVTITGTTVLVSKWMYDFLNRNESIQERGRKFIFRLARYIPQVRARVESELTTISDGFIADVEKRTAGLTYITSLPQDQKSKEEIISIINANLKISDFDWKKGYCSGSVYFFNADLIDLVGDVYSKTSYTNPLHPDLFPGVCKMEAEVVRMAVELFHGDENACGTMTSGGTESILMACKASRDFGLETKWIRKPEIVVPTTAHSAFDKAAQYLGLRVRSIPVDPHTLQADIKAMKRAINCNTVLLVGSAPNFPYGTMDDLTAISELGLKYNIPVHVDSCLGGFLTCFMEDAGYPVPLCDFRLPGVTSISADTHKYGFAPKGSSIVMYRDTKYRHHQYTVTTDWPGGVYGSPTVSGSRAGGNIAVCWAAMLYFGREGYVKATRDIVHTTKYIEKGLRRMKGIFIFGNPVTSVVAIGSHDFDVLRLSSALHDLGWNLSNLQFPSAIHLCVTHMHLEAGIADKFLKDVSDSLVEILKTPDEPVEGRMAFYGVAQSLPDRSIVGDVTRLFLDAMYHVPNLKKAIKN